MCIPALGTTAGAAGATGATEDELAASEGGGPIDIALTTGSLATGATSADTYIGFAKSSSFHTSLLGS